MPSTVHEPDSRRDGHFSPEHSGAGESRPPRSAPAGRREAPFNASGHPAMSLPCGMSQGLPVGLMLIGKYYDEPTIYRAAAAFESAGDWTKM